MNVILVLSVVHLSTGREIIARMNAEERVQITAGGETRFQSVKNGLTHVTLPFRGVRSRWGQVPG